MTPEEIREWRKELDHALLDLRERLWNGLGPDEQVSAVVVSKDIESIVFIEAYSKKEKP